MMPEPSPVPPWPGYKRRTHGGGRGPLFGKKALERADPPPKVRSEPPAKPPKPVNAKDIWLSAIESGATPPGI